jgi:Protein of unknown function (DUF3078)
MKKILCLLLTIFAFQITQAQEEKKEEMPAKVWKRTAGLGLDLGQLYLHNPRVGAGENRINLGGALTFTANYKKGRIAWDNNLGGLFGIQRLGAGVVPGSADKKPFQKSIDELRATSKYGYGLKKDGKYFVAADFSLLTQLTPTYTDNFMTDRAGIGALGAFFSPAITTLALGIDYKPTPNLSFFYAPLSWRAVIFGNSGIASNKLGASTVGQTFGLKSGETINQTAGSLLRTVYTNKFLKDKFVVSSNLALFGGYKGGGGIKMDWANQFGWEIYKGLQLSLGANAFYDKEIKVQVTDNDAPNGIKSAGIDPKTGKNIPVLESKVSIVQQFLLKYAKTF